MRILRINEQSDKDIIDWFTKHCKSIYASNFYSHVEIKEDGIHVKTNITFNRIQTNPPFQISFIAGDVSIENSAIENFSFLPKTINGNLDITVCDIKSLEGFPTQIYGNLSMMNCGVIESFSDIECVVTGVINFKEFPSLKELKAQNIKFRGSGIIIQDLPIQSLAGLPKHIQLTHKGAPYVHATGIPIKNLIGLPPVLSHLYISKCPLESIEGIPFEITEGFRSAVNITPSSQGDKEKVYSQIDLYYDMLERFQSKPHPASSPEENRASYIKWALEKNPEYASLVPPNEIPKDLQGQKILKRLDLF